MKLLDRSTAFVEYSKNSKGPIYRSEQYSTGVEKDLIPDLQPEVISVLQEVASSSANSLGVPIMVAMRHHCTRSANARRLILWLSIDDEEASVSKLLPSSRELAKERRGSSEGPLERMAMVIFRGLI